MKCYGYKDREGYPLAAWIWGHRLWAGQHWMEYLLEFLNVLAGFDYELGQGIKGASKKEYIRFARLGLRRFVFYDEHEKTRHPYDDEASRRLREALLQIVQTIDGNKQFVLETTRSLLRAFSAIEEQRSWFAKSLFPAHHNFLFWEALRRGATKYRGKSVPHDISPQELDAGITFDERNFFARGGELYYLMLSASTEKNQERRRFIARQLQHLLNDHNQDLGGLAEIIDKAWHSEGSSDKKGTVGWIPDPACPFYTIFTEDVETFLKADLDSLEKLDLLAHLIGFHVTLYIYHRAHPEATPERHEDGSCLDLCRLALLIDALEGADGGIVRGVSASLFREQEAHIEQKARDYVRQQVEAWGMKTKDYKDLDSMAQEHFNISALHGKTKAAFNRRVHALQEKFLHKEIDWNGYLNSYTELLTDLLLINFRKHFLGVHRKLSKSVGFVLPRKGPRARFVLGDNLLKAITLSNVAPGEEMSYDEFLERLYERYGLVVGLVQAKKSGLVNRQPINTQYYERNRTALLEKMKYAGLAIEYSDATAIVKH